MKTMIERIKNKIEKELVQFAKDIDTDYSLSSLSPLLSKSIKDFILRPGKRIRPTGHRPHVHVPIRAAGRFTGPAGKRAG